MALESNSAQPVIRPAGADDIDVIAEIARRAWEPIFRDRAAVIGDDLMSRERGGDWGETKANEVRRHCERDVSTVFVTELDGRVVGFITFAAMEEKGILEIGNNAIHPEYQGRGLGVAQYSHVLECGRRNGLRYAKVTTGLDDCHAAARAAYEKVGFDRSIPSITYYMEL